MTYQVVDVLAAASCVIDVLGDDVFSKGLNVFFHSSNYYGLAGHPKSPSAQTVGQCVQTP